MPLVNDIHSALNETRVRRIVEAGSTDAAVRAVCEARREGIAVSVAGGRHAMGAQQFGTDTLLVDTRPLSRILSFDPERGLVEAEAGILWPALLDGYLALQNGAPCSWGIAQKQTGADRLSVGGTLGANGHGRGLTLPPFVADVEAFTLVDAAGEVRRCSRTEEPELFSLVAGGYGLFGIVTSVSLRLTPRRKLERVVEVRRRDGLAAAFEERIREGFLYGDFQFSIDRASDGFLDEGVFSCYRPVDPDTPIPADQKELSNDNWKELLWLAHADKARAFQRYAGFYLATNGQIYWSDTHQLSPYFDGYHVDLDARSGAPSRATEIITEIYVPRPRLADFLDAAAEDFQRHDVEVIYGTVRLIERDPDSFLAWAREPWACTVLNLCTAHTPAGQERSAEAFRRLIDLAIARGGSYFLTYHKYARRDQIEACYPRFAEFLRRKRAIDPDERFQSDWYRHHLTLFPEI
ncbi:MAG TPA: FAD-binding oxidoreductase [Thermoanaerobaculia bacterium]|nr:FAD-binding oxidoreductase [Thermoanaerobaculia bacterium]